MAKRDSFLFREESLLIVYWFCISPYYTEDWAKSLYNPLAISSCH